MVYQHPPKTKKRLVLLELTEAELKILDTEVRYTALSRSELITEWVKNRLLKRGTIGN